MGPRTEYVKPKKKKERGEKKNPQKNSKKDPVRPFFDSPGLGPRSTAKEKKVGTKKKEKKRDEGSIHQKEDPSTTSIQPIHREEGGRGSTKRGGGKKK